MIRQVLIVDDLGDTLVKFPKRLDQSLIQVHGGGYYWIDGDKATEVPLAIAYFILSVIDIQTRILGLSIPPVVDMTDNGFEVTDTVGDMGEEE